MIPIALFQQLGSQVAVYKLHNGHFVRTDRLALYKNEEIEVDLCILIYTRAQNDNASLKLRKT